VERDGQPIRGVAEGVVASGALLVRIANGDVILVHAGEVNWR
jgi:biotin-(acetyl-CoA carboxylase) ligase